jgi:hypothetical protein
LQRLLQTQITLTPRLLTPLLLFILLNACSQPGIDGGSPGPISDEQLHGLMVERINTLQRSIEVLVFEQNRTQSELDQTRRRRTADITAAAIELRDSLEEVVVLEPNLGLSAGDRSVFLALAQRLRDDSEELAELANGRRVGSLVDAVARLQSSCDSCHSLYRSN